MPFLGKQPSRGLVGSADIDDNAVTLAKMAHQADGSIITYGTDTAPVLLAPDTSGEVLTTKGAGALPAFDAAANEDGVSGWIWVCGPHLTKRTQINWALTMTASDSDYSAVIISGAGTRLSSADVDAFQFLFSSGNIESGTVNVYGLANA